MPGDPRHCRQEAVECARLAQTLASPEGIDAFSDLARSWLKLAVDLERSQIFLKSYIGGSPAWCWLKIPGKLIGRFAFITFSVPLAANRDIRFADFCCPRAQNTGFIEQQGVDRIAAQSAESAITHFSAAAILNLPAPIATKAAISAIR